jgi:hypothetical protein
MTPEAEVAVLRKGEAEGHDVTSVTAAPPPFTEVFSALPHASVICTAMAAREFGLICGDFSVGVANQFLLPKSEEVYISRSVMPAGDPDEVSGRFLMRVYNDGHMVCNAKVEVTWGGHQSQAEPFLAIKVDDPSALGEKLGKLGGKLVELRFSRMV